MAPLMVCLLSKNVFFFFDLIIVHCVNIDSSDNHGRLSKGWRTLQYANSALFNIELLGVSWQK